MIDGIPLPARDGPFEDGFWSALDSGFLAHQCCDDCGRWTFPPRWRCPCGGALHYRTVSGRGTLWSWTQIHAPVLPAFTQFTPYVAAIIELAEQSDLRMVGPLVLQPGDPLNRVQPGDLRIGMTVEAIIAPIGDGVSWPSWKILEPVPFAERSLP